MTSAPGFMHGITFIKISAKKLILFLCFSFSQNRIDRTQYNVAHVAYRRSELCHSMRPFKEASQVKGEMGKVSFNRNSLTTQKHIFSKNVPIPASFVYFSPFQITIQI